MKNPWIPEDKRFFVDGSWDVIAEHAYLETAIKAETDAEKLNKMRKRLAYCEASVKRGR